jgi:hypothetical protein
MAERLAASSLDGDGTVLAVGTAVARYRGAEGTRGCGSTAETKGDVGPGGDPTTGAPR